MGRDAAQTERRASGVGAWPAVPGGYQTVHWPSWTECWHQVELQEKYRPIFAANKG